MQDRQWRPAETDACLDTLFNTGMRVENWLQIAVHLSLRVLDRRRSWDTEGEGYVSRK